jgi:hypothetical protein
MALPGVMSRPVRGASAGFERGAVVVCTLGMHRSGTSLVSRMLNLLGVDLGPVAPTSRKGADNPKGYWEHDSLVAIDDEILARFGGRWDEPPRLPASWPCDPRLADLREKARALLEEDFARSAAWGWKDPRTCLTLPFWQELVGPMRYVLCVRSPSAVAASLTCRNAMSAEKADRLWLRHVQASLAHTEDRPRMLVFYEDVLDDWRRELRRLAEFVGRPERAADPDVRAAVDSFVEAGMCHHRPSMADLVRDPRLSLSAKMLYLDLALRGVDRAEGVALDAGIPRPAEALAKGAAYREEAALPAECGERRLREELYVRSIARLEASLGAMTLDRDALVRESEALRRSLHAVRTSAAGRLVGFARWLLAHVLPPGTRRQQVFTAAAGSVARRLPPGPPEVVGPRTS